MDPATFSRLMQKMNKEVFSSNKMSVLQKYLHYNFTAQQCVLVINDFVHASDKVDALNRIAPRLKTITGEDAKRIVKAFVHGSDQLKAVEFIASHIDDTTNKYAVLDALTFAFDKDKARKILDGKGQGDCSEDMSDEDDSEFSQVPHQDTPPPGDLDINIQFGGLLGAFGLPTGRISFRTNSSQPSP